MAEGRAGDGRVAPGDHLQTAYRLWLPGHQVERAEQPWVDPYSFRPVVEPQPNFAAWPFGLSFWPLHRLLGTVGAWNAFVLLAYVGAGSFALLWLLALGLARGAALAGGLAFALAPYLVAQSSAGHLLAPVSMLLPLALWALERRRTILAGAALASIPLSGQVHLALGAIPFFALYAGARGRLTRGALVGVGAAVAAGVLVWATAVRGSVGAGGRSFAQVERYSAAVPDFLSRDGRHAIESFVFLGWLTPLLALGGLALLLLRPSNTLLRAPDRARDQAQRESDTVLRGRRLAAALGLGALVPVLLALGANLPGYEALWRAVPGLETTRVPARLMPVACLCLAALAAVSVDRLRWRALVPLALVAIALDLRWGVSLYRPSAADEDNAAYAALRAAPPGRLLELPVFLPDRQEGSTYLYYAMQAPRERPLGYSTVAPPAADALARRLRARCQPRELRALGVRYLAVHRPSRGGTTAPCFDGVRVLERDGGVTLLTFPLRDSRSRRTAPSP